MKNPFGGMAGIGDLTKMMSAARDMQGRVEEFQKSLEGLSVTGEAGAGLVRVTANAKGDLTGIEIDPSIFVPSEKQVVEDLILAAVKDAQGRATERAQSEAQRMAEDMGLPPGMKLPF
ncbi:YbaB/EbfC family nucleoid-associated protein [Paracoccus contaminans]|uniref:Nucleoid-associated protein B0A89_11270 n=1 Tax=Paracoccus contaminans TaxID=1945662 RepID=A0A1W6CZ26_9RHOB|nr:YbaB/EbfC family nucleoid-associated protein [Paracoccus contaminans]ARJ70121.1 30S ribosomal protein S21 [Paracoccus contaminans]